MIDSHSLYVDIEILWPFLMHYPYSIPVQYVVHDCLSAIYKHMLSDRKFGLTHNLIATKVMPTLIPHTVAPGLTLQQVGTRALFQYKDHFPDAKNLHAETSKTYIYFKDVSQMG